MVCGTQTRFPENLVKIRQAGDSELNVVELYRIENNKFVPGWWCLVVMVLDGVN